MLSAASAADAADAVSRDGGARDWVDIEGRLARGLGPPVRILADIRWSSKRHRMSERRLLASLVKDTDGFMARDVERRISLAISRRLAGNWDHAQSDECGLDRSRDLRRAIFLSSRPLIQTIGALFFLAHSILDGPGVPE